MGLVDKLITTYIAPEEEAVTESEAPTTEGSVQGNQADLDEMEAPDADEAGWLDAAEAEVGQGERPLPPAGTELPVLIGLLQVVPDPPERDYAAAILRTLPEDQRKQFVGMQGGQLHANLEAAFARDDPSWSPEAATNTGVQLPAAPTYTAMAKAAWDAGRDLVTGNGFDLNALQVASGGNLDGLVLDQNAPNDLQLDLDSSDGKLTAKIPMLGIAAISTSVGGMTITSGGGTLQGLEISLDGNTSAQGADNEVRLSAAAFGLNDISIATATNGLTTIGGLMMVGLTGSLFKTGQAGVLDPSAIAGQVRDDLVDWSRQLLKATTGLGAGGQGGSTAARTILENFSGTSNLNLHVGNLSVRDLASGSAGVDEQGNQVVDTEQDHIQVDGFDVAALDVSIGQGDTMVVLSAEADRLRNAGDAGALSAAQAERLDWIEGEIQRLAPMYGEYVGLKGLVGAHVPLQPHQQDRWAELQREFTTGVAEVSLGLMAVQGAHQRTTDEDGKVTERDLQDTMAGGLTVAVTSNELGGMGVEGVHNAGVTRLESLDRRLELSEEREGNVLDGTFIDAGLEELEVNGVMQDGPGGLGVAGVDASGIELQASGDAADVEVLRAGFDGLFSGETTVGSGEVRGVDLSARGDDVGGYVDHAGVEDVSYVDGETVVELDAGSVDGVRADANVKTDAAVMPTDVVMRSGSVEEGALEGLDAQGNGWDVSLAAGDVAGASVEDVQVAVADPASGTGTFELEGGSVDDLHVQLGTPGEGEVRGADVGTGSLDGVTVVRTEEGTDIAVEHLEGEDVLLGDTGYDVVGSVDGIEADGVGVQLNGEDELTGAEVERGSFEGLDAVLWRLPGDIGMGEDEASEASTAEEGPMKAGLLDTASGTANVTIPMRMLGLDTIHLSVPVQEGFVDVGAIGIDATRDEGSFRGGITERIIDALAGSMIRVEDGGLYVHAGPLRLQAALSSSDYAGLESGGVSTRKGGVHIAAFTEGLMNGVTGTVESKDGSPNHTSTDDQAELENDPDRAARRRERRAQREQRREERAEDRAKRRGEEPVEDVGEEPETYQELIDQTVESYEEAYAERFDLRGIQVDVSGLATGGEIGYGENAAGNARVEDFDLSFQVGGDLRGSVERVEASQITTSVGLGLDEMGFGGVDVTVSDAISEKRSITARVESGEIVGLSYQVDG